ncbi:MAG TPA: glutathione S-transferase N-terminal domain-containing protein [Polyangiaceae bacterium]|nr:glutathione S-transferase N-terminal domain-containing protein [Polyangiaceae bacterium]
MNGSNPNWRVWLALHEKGIAFEPRRLRLMRGPRETRSPKFLELNPRGKTPLLIEPDGAQVSESLAILTYLELRYFARAARARGPRPSARTPKAGATTRWARPTSSRSRARPRAPAA